MAAVNSDGRPAPLDEAVEFIEEEQYLPALAVCRAELDSEPDNADAIGLQVIAQIYTGEGRNVGELLKQAATAHPGNYRIQQALGLYEVLRGHFADAEQLLRVCTQIEADDPLSWHWLAMAQEGRWKLKEALESSRRALELRPRNLRMRLQHIYLLVINGRQEEAIEAAKEGQMHHPLSAEMRRALGYAQLRNDQPEESFHGYQEAAALNEQDYDAYEGMKEALRHRIWLYRKLSNLGARTFAWPPRIRGLIVPLLFLGAFILARTAGIFPVLMPVAWVGIGLLWTVVLGALMGRFLGTMGLLFHHSGHRLLWPVERVEAIWGLALLATTILCGVGYLLGREAIGGFLSLLMLIVIGLGGNLKSVPKLRVALAWAVGMFGTFIGLWLLFLNPK